MVLEEELELREKRETLVEAQHMHVPNSQVIKKKAISRQETKFSGQGNLSELCSYPSIMNSI